VFVDAPPPPPIDVTVVMPKPDKTEFPPLLPDADALVEPTPAAPTVIV
jgi:hypothetical protein